MKSKINIGIIGAGSIVESNHLPVLKNMEELNVSWIYDKNVQRSRLLADMYGITAISESDVDIHLKGIGICLLTIPYGAREPFIKKCAGSHIGLYVEKPFATTLEEHQRYCALFPPARLAIGLQRRYYRTVSNIRSLINSGIFGPLKSIEFRQGHFTLKGGKGYLSDASLSGGGIMIESAIHVLDQILLFTKSNSVIIEEIQSLQKNGIDYDTVFKAILKTPDQQIPLFAEITTLRNLNNGIILFFEHAYIKCTMAPDANLLIYTNSHMPMVYTLNDITYNESGISEASSVVQSFFIFWTQFIEAYNTGETNLTSGVSSYLTTSMIQQLYTHSKQSRR